MSNHYFAKEEANRDQQMQLHGDGFLSDQTFTVLPCKV